MFIELFYVIQDFVYYNTHVQTLNEIYGIWIHNVYNFDDKKCL